MSKIKDEKQLIEDFIFDDKVQNILSKIDESVMNFNLLEITGMSSQEIKHSNLLSWVFGDNEHELGYAVFEKFLHKVIDVNENNQNIQKLKHYLYLPTHNKEVVIYREKDNIDLLFVDNQNNTVIAIENKIYADERTDGEDGGQLKKYNKIVKKRYPNFEQFYIYLTISAQEPSEENSETWMVASYQMISDSIEEIINTQKELSDKTKMIFESYIDLLKRREIVSDTKLKELCDNIWKNSKYKEALLILNQYQPDVGDLREELQNYLTDQDINIYSYNNKGTDFAIFTNNYKKAYPKWKDSIKPESEVQLDIRFGFYIVKSSIQFWVRLSDNASENTLQYFNKIKEKLDKPRSKKRIDIYAEDMVDDFDRFNIENTKSRIIEEFINIIQTVDDCFE